jgi:hypothetical protein
MTQPSSDVMPDTPNALKWARVGLARAAIGVRLSSRQAHACWMPQRDLLASRWGRVSESG